MGYDCHFQLVDAYATQRMLAALVTGAPPPPSEFDALPEAQALWSQARALVLGPDAAAASRAAGELVAHWNAASRAFVWTRNMAATYHPIRMEDALKGLPSHRFVSPDRFLFDALPVRLSLSGRLEGNSQVGGFVANVDDAAHEIRALYDDLHEPMQRRLRPILSLFRAAERHRLAVLESADLLGVTSAHQAMLHWPGLARYGLDGGPLTAEEWTAFAQARPSQLDLHDAVDRIVECDVHDPSARAAVLALLLDRSNTDWTSAERERIAQWIARCFATEDLALASRAIARYRGAGSAQSARVDDATLAALLRTTTDASVVSHWVKQYGPDATSKPGPELAALLLEALCRTTPSFDGIAPSHYARHLGDCGASNRAFGQMLDDDGRFEYLREMALDLGSETMEDNSEALLRAVERRVADGPLDAVAARWFGDELARCMCAEVETDEQRAVRERAGELWCALYERQPSIDPCYSDSHLEDEAFVLRITERLLLAPRSTAQLRAVAASIGCTADWDNDDGAWIAPFCARHRDALVALIELGLASGERDDLRAASALLSPNAMRDPRWEPPLREAVDRDDRARIEALAPHVERTRDNDALFAQIELAQFVRTANPSCAGVVALLRRGVDITVAAMRGVVAAHQADAASQRSIQGIGLRLSSALINAGWPREAVVVVDVALEAVARESSATLLYNQACAWAKAGDATRAARVLAACAAIDRSQLDDAKGDSDFDAIRNEPVFAALFASS